MIDEDELEDLKEFIGETMTQLEMCFPSEFFDITEHLMIHMHIGTWSTLPTQNVNV